MILVSGGHFLGNFGREKEGIKGRKRQKGYKTNKANKTNRTNRTNETNRTNRKAWRLRDGMIWRPYKLLRVVKTEK